MSEEPSYSFRSGRSPSAKGPSRLLGTSAPAAVILVRLLVGGVFLAEGIQKFLFPDELGVGRFAKIGIPRPDVTAPFVGAAEIVCGALVILGLFARPAAAALLVDISVAIVSTKVPILLGHGFGPFTLPKLAHYGFWSMVHEARVDFCMWLGSLFLIIVGAGRASFDALLAHAP
jgi:putative oxidoreductase